MNVGDWRCGNDSKKKEGGGAAKIHCSIVFLLFEHLTLN